VAEPQFPLKIVVVAPAQRALLDAARAALLPHVDADELRELGDGALLVHTDTSASDVRDWIVAALPDGASTFVAAFEQWSGRGPAVDSVWLGRRGH